MEVLDPDERGLSRAISFLRSGGIGAFPTDTVYGLGARIDLESAVRKVFEAKGRGYSQPLPVLIADVEQLDDVAREIPPLARRLATRFWPGGLTLVLRKLPKVSPLISAGGDTVAVRLPAHPVPLAIVRGLGAPVTGTSANLSGHPAPTTAQGVIAQLASRLDFIIDGSDCPGGKESTILDLTQEPPSILREGAIPRDAIEEMVGSPVS